MESKKTALIGVSTNPSRYAYMAANLLSGYGYDFVPVGLKPGKLFGREILDLRQQPVIQMWIRLPYTLIQLTRPSGIIT